MIGILVNTNGDLKVDASVNSEGKIMGLAIGNCTADIIERVLKAYPGDFKNIPTIGINIQENLNAPNGTISRAKIQNHLKSQGIKISNVEVNGNEISINYDN